MCGPIGSVSAMFLGVGTPRKSMFLGWAPQESPCFFWGWPPPKKSMFLGVDTPTKIHGASMKRVSFFYHCRHKMILFCP